MHNPDDEREESALRYSEENYRLMVETAPDAASLLATSSFSKPLIPPYGYSTGTTAEYQEE